VYVLTPKFDETTREWDVKAHYFDNARWVFGLGALYLGSWILFSSVMLGDPIQDRRTVVRLCMAGVFVALAILRNERVHVAGALLIHLLIVGVILNTSVRGVSVG
jgi:hypothetical protein